MPLGIICGRITPARGNLEHRPLSGAVWCVSTKYKVYQNHKLIVLTTFPWLWPQLDSSLSFKNSSPALLWVGWMHVLLIRLHRNWKLAKSLIGNDLAPTEDRSRQQAAPGGTAAICWPPQTQISRYQISDTHPATNIRFHWTFFNPSVNQRSCTFLQSLYSLSSEKVQK